MEVFIIILTLNGYDPRNELVVSLTPYTPKIPRLLFDDDNLVFNKATSSTCHILRNLINELCTLSGQLANFHIPVIVFSKQI